MRKKPNVGIATIGPRSAILVKDWRARGEACFLVPEDQEYSVTTRDRSLVGRLYVMRTPADAGWIRLRIKAVE